MLGSLVEQGKRGSPVGRAASADRDEHRMGECPAAVTRDSRFFEQRARGGEATRYRAAVDVPQREFVQRVAVPSLGGVDEQVDRSLRTAGFDKRVCFGNDISRMHRHQPSAGLAKKTAISSRSCWLSSGRQISKISTTRSSPLSFHASCSIVSSKISSLPGSH